MIGIFQCGISVILILNCVFSKRVGSRIFVFGTTGFAVLQCTTPFPPPPPYGVLMFSLCYKLNLIQRNKVKRNIRTFIMLFDFHEMLRMHVSREFRLGDRRKRKT